MVRIALEAMAAMDGLDGCALADAETGMVWHAAGQAGDIEGLSEAAVDFWRLHSRLRRKFDPLGQLQVLVLVHSRQRMSIVGCGPALLLVAVSARDARLDWVQWRRRTTELQELASSF
ncbi:MAG: hypothetical protein V4864_21825 [Pseudomonadota bacterium]